MKNLNKPIYIILYCILPLLIFITCGYFYVETGSNSVLDGDVETIVGEHGLLIISLLGVLTLVNLCYTIYLFITKKRTSLVFYYIELVICSLFLFTNIILFLKETDNYIYLFQGASTVFNIFYSISSIVIMRARKNRYIKYHPALRTILSICVAYAVLILSTQVNSSSALYILLSFIIFILFLCAIFFIIEGLCLSILKNSFHKFYPFYIAIFGLIFPLLGIFINAVLDDIFGDFSYAPILLFAFISALVYLLPNTKNQIIHLILFIFRIASLVYVIYFTLVFLPLLPLGFLTLFIGVGFLILCPPILLFLCIYRLNEDLKYLKTKISPIILVSIAFIALFMYPTIYYISLRYDRHIFFKFQDYVYQPNYQSPTKFNSYEIYSLEHNLPLSVNKNNWNYFYHKTPILSDLHRLVIYDNLYLPIEKMRELQYITTSNYYLPKIHRFNESISIISQTMSRVKSESTYNEETSTWESWIDLEIKNQTDRMAEYTTSFDLPSGSFINDYYLYVGNVKEQGMLAEKKSANWVYDKFVQAKTDPGLLNYIGDNTVELKVFPFSSYETRYTGFKIIHKEPCELIIDNQKLKLGDTSTRNIPKYLDGLIYITAKEKQDLIRVQRKPYYHFVVDASSSGFSSDYIDAIQFMLDQSLASKSGAKISFVNVNVETFELDDNYSKLIQNYNYEYGFFLDRVVREILLDSYSHPTSSYPLIVVLTKDMDKAVILNSFADLEYTFPDNNYLLYPNKLFDNESYQLNNKFQIKAYNLNTFNVDFIVDDSIEDTIIDQYGTNEYIHQPLTLKPVREFNWKQNKKIYLPDDNNPSIIVNDPQTFTFDIDNTKNEWETGLQMSALSRVYSMCPYLEKDKPFELVTASFQSHILSSRTSFIVLETETQKQELLKKQEEILSGKGHMVPGNETQRMSEPNFYIFVLLISLTLGLYVYKKK